MKFGMAHILLMTYLTGMSLLWLQMKISRDTRTILRVEGTDNE